MVTEQRFLTLGSISAGDLLLLKINGFLVEREVTQVLPSEGAIKIGVTWHLVDEKGFEIIDVVGRITHVLTLFGRKRHVIRF